MSEQPDARGRETGGKPGLGDLYRQTMELQKAAGPALTEIAMVLLIEVVMRWPGLTVPRILAVAGREYINELAYLRSRVRTCPWEMNCRFCQGSADQRERCPLTPVSRVAWLMRELDLGALFERGIHVHEHPADRELVYVPVEADCEYCLAVSVRSRTSSVAGGLVPRGDQT